MATEPEVERRIRESIERGDSQGAAAEGIRGYGEQILLYLRRVLHDEEMAREAFSDFCERLWKNIDRFRAASSFRTWAYRVAWSAAAEIHRDPHRKRARPMLSGELSAVAEQVRESTANYLKTTAKDRLAAVRDSLNAEDRSLLILRVERELSWKEIAEVMAESGDQVSEAALKKRFSRLKERLREHIVGGS